MSEVLKTTASVFTDIPSLAFNVVNTSKGTADHLIGILQKRLKVARTRRTNSEECCQSITTTIRLIERISLQAARGLEVKSSVVMYPDGVIRTYDAETNTHSSDGLAHFFPVETVIADMEEAKSPDLSEADYFLLEWIGDVSDFRNDADCETFTFSKHALVELVRKAMRVKDLTEALCEDEGCPHHGTKHVCNDAPKVSE